MSASPDEEVAPGPRRGARIVEIEDERGRLAAEALRLIERAFAPQERQPVEQIAMEIEEKRLGLLTSYDFHLFVAVDPGRRVVAVASGVYLGGVNTGFITYLAVRRRARGERLGRRMRTALINAFRSDARILDWSNLDAVVGEVRTESPWLQRLVRDRAVVPLDLTYYHPGIEPGEGATRWTLYRQKFADEREALPVDEVRKLLYAIWRRAYRVQWPLRRDAFRDMLDQLEGRDRVGSHPGVGADA